MPRKIVLFLLITILLTAVPPAHAQQPTKIPRIGLLQRRVAPTPANPDPLSDAFLKGLQEIGYIDGKNIKIEHRYAEGRTDRLPGIIAEFLQLKVDVIVVASSQAIRVAKQATSTIPIVIVTQGDPVAEKLVNSLARPGGNITGLTRLTVELSGKAVRVVQTGGSEDLACWYSRWEYGPKVERSRLRGRRSGHQHSTAAVESDGPQARCRRNISSCR